jgi:hypothetical protein
MVWPSVPNSHKSTVNHHDKRLSLSLESSENENSGQMEGQTIIEPLSISRNSQRENGCMMHACTGHVYSTLILKFDWWIRAYDKSPRRTVRTKLQ